MRIEDFRHTRLSGLAIKRIVEDIHAGEELTSPDIDRRIQSLVMGSPVVSQFVAAKKRGALVKAQRPEVGARTPTRDAVPCVPGGTIGGADV